MGTREPESDDMESRKNIRSSRKQFSENEVRVVSLSNDFSCPPPLTLLDSILPRSDAASTPVLLGVCLVRGAWEV